MAPTIGELIVWLVVGALAGSATGMLVKRQREGFGRLAVSYSRSRAGSPGRARG